MIVNKRQPTCQIIEDAVIYGNKLYKLINFDMIDNAFSSWRMLENDDTLLNSNAIYKLINTDLDTNGAYRDWETDRKSTRLNSSHSAKSRMPSSA